MTSPLEHSSDAGVDIGTPTSPLTPEELEPAPTDLADARGVSIVEPDGTWTETGVGLTSSTPVVMAVEQQRHRNSMQTWLLMGVGILIVFMTLILVAGLGFHWISEDFAKLLAQMTIPALLTFGGAIVGSLFSGGGANSTGSRKD